MNIFKWLFNPDWFTFNMGGGGGPNTTYSQTSNIPEYARPYVEQMLGATQKQLFTGNTDAQGAFTPTGFNNFIPYGATYQKDTQGNPLRDASGNVMYTNTAQQQAQSAIAPQSAGQQMATNAINQYVAPSQTGGASAIAGDVAGRSAASGYYSPLRAERFQLGRPDQIYANQVRSDSFTAPFVSQAYMSPYMQNVVNSQQREAMRQSNIAKQQQQAQAVGQGAFGGSRQGIVEAERQRNLANQLGDIQGTGLQQAYQQGMGQFNAEQAAYLQAQQANQQAGLTAQQANQQANLNTGIQNLQSQQQAQAAQEASRQFGAQLGLQGYGQSLQAAQTLGSLGQQQYQQDMGTIQAMAGMGAQEQAQTQNIINQAMQNYGTAQQYPLMQLGVMSNMLRGLPMQSSTTNMYQAQPSMVSQLAGAAGTGLGLYQQGQQAKLFKKGGEVKLAPGGIATGVDYPTLQKRVQGPSFDDKELAAKSQDTQTDQATKDIMTAEMARRARLRAGAPVMAANGGIIAFKDGEEVKDLDDTKKGILSTLKEQGPVSSATGSSPEKSDVDPRASHVGPYLASKAGTLKDVPKDKPTYEDTLQDQIAKLSKSQEKLEADRNLSVTDRMKQQEAEREKMGLPSPYGSELEKNKKRREKVEEDSVQDARENLTMFLQRWGTTPGATLLAMNKAGMEMVEKSGLDRKARRKLLDQLDGVERDLRTGEYQRRLGEEERARNHIEKAGKEYNQVGEKIVEYTTKLINNEATNAAREKIAELSRQLQQAKIDGKEVSDYKTRLNIIAGELKANPKFKDVPDAMVLAAADKIVRGHEITKSAASASVSLGPKQQDAETRAEKEAREANEKALARAGETFYSDKGRRDAAKADKANGISETDPNSQTAQLRQKHIDMAKNAGKSTASAPAPTSAPASGSQFVEGKTYQDANGNKAVYKNGKFEAVK